MSAPAAPISRAMVLAAGRGTRMRPLTDSMPKALVPVAGRTLVDRALDQVAAAGIGEAVVNLHHLADALETHLAARPGPPRLSFSDERARLLDTGGGLLAARPLLGVAPAAALNADAVFAGPPPLATLLAAWARAARGTLALMLLVPREAAHGYTRAGDFFLAADGAVPQRRGAAATAPYVYTGAQILHPAAFDGVAEAVPGTAFSLNPVWDAAIAAGRLAGVVYPGAWADVGTPAGIAAAEAMLAAAETGV
ncbi:MAG: nucleotidyltransferase family protein [Pseudomonadota bacterium]